MGQETTSVYNYATQKPQKSEEELNREAMEAIDHSFMFEVVEGLLELRNEVYRQKFESRKGCGTSQEYQEIEIYSRFIYELKDQISSYQRFDALDKLTKAY